MPGTDRRTASAWGRPCRAVAILVLAAMPIVADGGQSAPGIELTPQTRMAMGDLQELWARWVAAFREDQPDQARAAVDELLDLAHGLGMERLPDLSRAAVAAAVRAARAGDLARADWALEAAARLDDARPETAFVGSHVARLEGSYLTSVRRQVSGYLLLFRLPRGRYMWGNDLLLWMVLVALATSAFFVLLLVATKGRRAALELLAIVERVVPRGMAPALVVLLLGWPLLLPDAVAWLLLYWSILLFAQATVSERVLLAVGWLLLAAAPVLVVVQRQHVEVATSPAARVLDNLAQRRLTGSLLNDLQALAVNLPDSVAVQQLLADVHRHLGAGERAAELYEQVVGREGGNSAALVDLGVHAFEAGDLEAARQYFERATAADPGSAAAQFNLAQTYSATYAFGRAEEALRRARILDPLAVGSWIRAARGLQPVALDGGLARMAEIRRELTNGWRQRGLLIGAKDLARRSLAAPLVLLAALLASGLTLLRRRLRTWVTHEPAPPEGALAFWCRALVPGLREAEAGAGWRTLAALLPPILLLALPLSSRVGYPVPWGIEPALPRAWLVTSVGLAIYVALRLRRGMRRAAEATAPPEP